MHSFVNAGFHPSDKSETKKQNPRDRHEIREMPDRGWIKYGQAFNEVA